jgi:hypothetical protein
MSVVKNIQTRLDTNHARRPRKNHGPFFDPPIFGAVLKTSVRDVAVTVKVSVMFFLHDIMTNQDKEVT